MSANWIDMNQVLCVYSKHIYLLSHLFQKVVHLRNGSSISWGRVARLKGYSTLHHSEHQAGGFPDVAFAFTAASAQMDANSPLVREFRKHREERQKFLRSIAEGRCPLGYRFEFELEVERNAIPEQLLYPFASRYLP
jgi:hypothetical protein